MPTAQAWGREIAFGLPVWVAFLLVLEPGNVARAIEAGGTLAWDKEVVRIFGASLLGASSTPLVLALMRRFPIERGNLWRHLTIQSLGGAGIALGLIVVSCILAAWFGIGDSRPVLTALPGEIAANWPLLVFCIAALSATAHAVHFSRRHAEAERKAVEQAVPAGVQVPSSPSGPFITSIPVKSRGRMIQVGLATVDWIETQGNYLALHAGTAVHLIRETAVRFEEKVDPKTFIRIHRRTLVALDRVRDVKPLANGDARVELTDGTSLRMSRGFRERTRSALTERQLGSRHT